MNQNFAKQINIFKQVDQTVHTGEASNDPSEVWNHITYCVDYIDGQRIKDLIEKRQPSEDCR